jgi:hypothetical protein
MERDLDLTILTAGNEPLVLPIRGPSMKPNSHFPEGAVPCSDRTFVGWTPTLRYIVLIVVAGVSTGCADDVVMTNPSTGMTQICQESLGGLNPWSQTMACVGNYEAQGWTRDNQE